MLASVECHDGACRVFTDQADTVRVQGGIVSRGFTLQQAVVTGIILAILVFIVFAYAGRPGGSSG